ncbi:FAD-dependent oxidoreductase [Demetria terragena]|uniref:FAD-dependent oxidoreductase n=1 Tax=Demetria terragena TaxID=63959 RepID=UPI000362B4DD|nr:FAD-dependent oxidoreductase [Demetria terragena]
MAHYVVTQSCCADASCVVACPVNCIHPAPGEPGFGTTEMLYVDPKTCVGCGACTTACPVGAIVPDTSLNSAQKPFLQLNAEYYEMFPHEDRSPVAHVPAQRRLRRPGPFRVAIVGAGPAGLYTADELLAHPEVSSVEVFDQLRTPHGLARFGVAPDHQHTKGISDLFAAIEREPRFSYRLGERVGVDITLTQLRETYDAVVYAVGASADRPLGIPGEDLTGSLAATDVVGWYNGHPEQSDLHVPLGQIANPSQRAVIIGNGNVALDVARILTADPAALAETSIDHMALETLQHSDLREVVILGRRGPAQAAFTAPELIGLAGLEDINVRVEANSTDFDRTTASGRVLADLAARPQSPDDHRRRIVLRFTTSPVEVTGTRRVTGVLVARNELIADPDGGVRAQMTSDTETIEAGIVIRAIGFRGKPVADLPFNEVAGTVPHEQGRVAPGVYVVGWIKRGPSGFIGTNKTCAQETVSSLLDDLDAGATAMPRPLTARGVA